MNNSLKKKESESWGHECWHFSFKYVLIQVKVSCLHEDWYSMNTWKYGFESLDERIYQIFWEASEKGHVKPFSYMVWGYRMRRLRGKWWGLRQGELEQSAFWRNKRNQWRKQLVKRKCLLQSWQGFTTFFLIDYCLTISKSIYLKGLKMLIRDDHWFFPLNTTNMHISEKT